jgi:glycosyltransferase involved in cell wall biosynthesis
MISIVTVTFNAADTLEETLASIERQTYRDFEVVAVDGGSTDGTVDVFKRHKDIVGTLISEPDKGVYDAMNKGVKAAKGDVLFFLNAQDTFFDDHVLERVAHAFNDRSKPYIVFGDIFFSNRQNIPAEELTMPPGQVRCYKDAGPNEPGICHQCIFYRKAVFDKIGGYDLKYRIFGDYDFNIRAFDFAGDRYMYIPHVIANFDLGGLSTLANTKHNDLLHKENMELREKYERMKRATRRRRFVFSRGHSLLDGGYFVQFFGVRVDWTPAKRYYHRIPLELPFSFDFQYGIPETLEMRGFENILNGVTQFPGGRGCVLFRISEKPSAVDMALRFVLSAYIKKAGDISVAVSLNGRRIDTVDFSGYGEGVWRDQKFECLVDASAFKLGLNELRFSSDAKSASVVFGVQGIAVESPEPLPEIPCQRPISFSSASGFEKSVRTRGFYTPEDWGAWLQPVARVRLCLRASDGGFSVVSKWQAFLYHEVRARVSVNGKQVAELEFRPGEELPAVRRFEVPGGVVRQDGAFDMEIITENPEVPAKLFDSPDWRRLGVGLCSIEFVPVPEGEK